MRAAVLHEQLGRYLRPPGESEESFAAFDRAMELMPAEPPSPERAVLLERYARPDAGGPLPARRRAGRGGARDGRRFGLRALESRALNTLGMSRVQLGELDEGLAQLREAGELADWVGPPDVSVRAAINLSRVLDLAGQTEEALAVVRRALAVIGERAPSRRATTRSSASRRPTSCCASGGSTSRAPPARARPATRWARPRSSCTSCARDRDAQGRPRGVERRSRRSRDAARGARPAVARAAAR